MNGESSAGIDELELGNEADPRSFAQILVDNAIDRVFTEELASECWGRQLTVVLEVPNEQWSERAIARIAETVRAAAVSGGEIKGHLRPYTFRRKPSLQTRPTDDALAIEMLNAVGHGRSIIGVFSPSSAPLPLLTDRPDVHLETGRPSRSDIARAVQTATDQILDPDALPPLDGGDLDGLALAVRPRASAAETCSRLFALARPPIFDEDVPDLRDFAAFGEARAWGLTVLRAIERIKSGDPTAGMNDLPRGVLLVGPPGTGKTLFASALAKTLGINAILTSASEWLASGDSHLGAVVKAMRTSVEQARSRRPCILFIDECDSIVDRDLERGDSVSWWVNFVNAVLTAVDGAVRNRGVILIGACNNMSRVDPALRRSGRMERVIELGLPTECEREAILAHYLKGVIDPASVATLARRSEGRTGADLERAVREAKAAAADAERQILLRDLVEVLFPKSHAGESSRHVAAHEAGHAVTAVLLGVEVRQVDLRGFTRLTNSALQTREAIAKHLTVLMAGRAADEILCGTAVSGAGGSAQSDLGLATKLSSIGHAALGFGSTLRYRAAIDGAAALIETDPAFARLVERDLQAALRRARRLLLRHKNALKAVAVRLEAEHFLDGDQVAQLVRDNQGARSWII
ncbi:AAA family ATPase [Hansschlegelia quercus]|uniref:AAA family ATPase n=1 Tax=Hansschlegelia quercus TaxID=2528245 RepID=A0A4Q9GJM7_9HYPH|nr:AAA family ATPase [Hansschlegelia quercus]TBN54463.1 AAA family ATPase [Hansschlegelia quercus]